MRSRINIIGFLILVALLVCSSCVREIVMDAGEKPMVVVECVISNTAPQTLHLRYTKGASKKDYEFVTEADAVLHDLTTGKEAGRFVKAEDGVWTLDYEAEDEHDYRLEVNVPGYETITAEQTMPVRPKVKALRICLTGPYWLVVHSHGEWEKCCYYNFTSNQNASIWVYAMNYNKETGKRELAEYICSSRPADDFNLTDIEYTPKLDTIQTIEPSPFLAPQPPYNNGSLFTCVVGLYHELSGRRMHREYLRYSSSGSLIVSGTFEGFYPVEFVSEKSEDVLNGGVITDPAEDQAYLVFASVSDEYDEYYHDARRLQGIQESSQLSDIYLRDNVFSNINGGLGIFGAKAETKMVWSDSPSLGILSSIFL